jgi:hypothetical protein
MEVAKPMPPDSVSPYPATLGAAPPALEALLQATRLLKEHPTAEILGVEVSTLRRWRWSGDGPPFVKIGYAVRYDPRELAAFIKAGRRRSTSDSGEAL